MEEKVKEAIYVDHVFLDSLQSVLLDHVVNQADALLIRCNLGFEIAFYVSQTSTT